MAEHFTNTELTTVAADVFRTALTAAGIDVASCCGVRPTGPLAWMPNDPPPTEPPVAIARRRVIARRTVVAMYRRRRELREVARYWSEAA